MSYVCGTNVVKYLKIEACCYLNVSIIPLKRCHTCREPLVTRALGSPDVELPGVSVFFKCHVP